MSAPELAGAMKVFVKANELRPGISYVLDIEIAGISYFLDI